jgi:hypothetical protein
MAQQFEAAVAQSVFDVEAGAREEIIDAKHIAFLSN